MATRNNLYGLGAFQGALGGAAAGTSVAPGIGSAVGAGAGLVGGILGTYLDAEEQERRQEAIDQATAQFEEAQRQYDQSIAQVESGAREAVRQVAASKQAMDTRKADQAEMEVKQQAAQAGLTPSEQVDAAADVRQRVTEASAAASPAVMQEAMAGANAMLQTGVQKAAMGLNSAQDAYQFEVSQIAGQPPPSAAATIGGAIGAIGQMGSNLRGAGVDPLTGQMLEGYDPAKRAFGTGQAKLGGTGQAKLGGTGQETPFSGESVHLERALAPLEEEQTQHHVQQSLLSGGRRRQIDLPGPGESGYVEDPFAAGAQPVETPQPPAFRPPPALWKLTTEQRAKALGGPTFYAAGGMAGTQGPEIALLGEEGPELVLNAKQTQELAGALGAEPYKEGGVAGDKKIKGYEEGGVAGGTSRIAAGPPARPQTGGAQPGSLGGARGGTGGIPARFLGPGPQQEEQQPVPPSSPGLPLSYDELSSYINQINWLIDQDEQVSSIGMRGAL